MNNIRFLVLIVIIIIIIRKIYIYNSRKPKENVYIKNKFCIFENDSVPDYSKIQYFREIPCNHDIYKIFWVAKSYNMNVSIRGFIGANVFKWISEKKVTVIKEGNSCKLHVERFQTDNYIEKSLQKIIFDIAGDEYIEASDLKNRMYSDLGIIKWYNTMFYEERDRLIKEGYLRVKDNKLIIPSKVYEDATQIIGLIKFLKEETWIEKKKDIDIFLWDEYIMIAQMFGIAKELKNKYKDLYKLLNVEHLQFLDY